MRVREGGGMVWCNGGRLWCDGGRGGNDAVMGTHRTWVVVFVRGQLSGRSFPFVSGRLRTRAVGGRTRADDGGCGGYRARARARGGAGCHCGRGRVLVVWLPHHPQRRGPCIRCERKKGEGDVRTHLQTVTMASIVTIWTTGHIATSSPTHSIAFQPLVTVTWRSCWGC